jgi:Class II Aldolase and Adducin N-terminal domain
MTVTTLSSEVKIAKTPSMPTFKTAAEERLHRKQRLASAFRLFAKFGFSEGVAGHITVRDPEMADHFWVNPFGMHFAHIRVSDLVLVNEKGDVVEGDRLVNESAFAIHSRVHMARPDVVAAAHAHSHTERRGPHSGGCWIRLPRMHALFTKITACSRITPASSTTCRRATALPRL